MIKSQQMFWAGCDFPECTAETRDYEQGNNVVYRSVEDLKAAFEDRFGGGLEDWGWLLTADGKHFCGDHWVWNEDEDERIPMPEDMCPTCRGSGVTFRGPKEPGPLRVTCSNCGGDGKRPHHHHFVPTPAGRMRCAKFDCPDREKAEVQREL